MKAVSYQGVKKMETPIIRNRKSSPHPMQSYALPPVGFVAAISICTMAGLRSTQEQWSATKSWA
jgi:hypothetical protein